MRVLSVIASGALGGGAQHVHDLLQQLQPLGVFSAALVGQEGPLAQKLTHCGVQVFVADMMRTRLNMPVLRRLTQVIEQFKPDIVHAHGTRAAFFAALTKPFWRLHRPKKSMPKLVYTAHGLAYRQPGTRYKQLILQAAEALACRMADQVISVSQSDLLDLQARCLLGKTPTAHIGNAVDTHLFVPASAAQQAAARIRLGLPIDKPIVGTTARLVRQKGIDRLLDAMHHCPQAMLAVIGEGPLRDMLAQHPLVKNGRAVLLGARTDIAASLAAFDIFALSSLWEGEPIALLEAMACGLPCVATHTEGAAELFAAAGCGLLVPQKPTALLGLAFNKLLANPVDAQMFGKKGRHFACTRTPVKLAARVFSMYQKINPEA